MQIAQMTFFRFSVPDQTFFFNFFLFDDVLVA